MIIILAGIIIGLIIFGIKFFTSETGGGKFASGAEFIIMALLLLVVVGVGHLYALSGM